MLVTLNIRLNFGASTIGSIKKEVEIPDEHVGVNTHLKIKLFDYCIHQNSISHSEVDLTNNSFGYHCSEVVDLQTYMNKSLSLSKLLKKIESEGWLVTYDQSFAKNFDTNVVNSRPEFIKYFFASILILVPLIALMDHLHDRSVGAILFLITATAASLLVATTSYLLNLFFYKSDLDQKDTSHDTITSNR